MSLLYMRLILGNDLKFTFDNPTLFSLKRVLIKSSFNGTVYSILNGYNLISMITNVEQDVYLEPITAEEIIILVREQFDRPIQIDGIELEIELL